jgi:fructose-1,6-bisphosphatase/inositol monophosphatase family enzyme
VTGSPIDINRVSDILREVGRDEVMSRWQRLNVEDTRRKSAAGDLVTVADLAAEAALEQRLTDLLPGSHVVGEEGVSADPARLDLIAAAGFVWVIDPIDGTRAYSKGRPDFDMMVALLRDGASIAGWIYHPVTGTMHCGERGSGAWRETSDGTRARRTAAGRTNLDQLTGLVRMSWPKDDPRRRIAGRAGRFAGLIEPKSAGRNYAQILDGTADFLLNSQPHAWDHLPGLALLAEIGHVHGLADGTPYRPGVSAGPLLTAPSSELWPTIRDALLADPEARPC